MTITKEKIEVIVSVERRRRWSSEEKRSIPQECLYLLSPESIIYPPVNFLHGEDLWRIERCKGFIIRKMLSLKDLEKRVRELERLLGKKTFENEVLRRLSHF